MPGSAVHGNVQLAADSLGRRAEPATILHHRQCHHDSLGCLSDCQHRKGASVVEPAGPIHRISIAGRNNIFFENVGLIPLYESIDAVSFAVKVRPHAKTNAITGTFADALKVSLTAPPVNSRANEACIEFFAKLLKLPRSSVTIAFGLSSRRKVIRVSGLTAKQITERIGM